MSAASTVCSTAYRAKLGGSCGVAQWRPAPPRSFRSPLRPKTNLNLLTARNPARHVMVLHLELCSWIQLVSAMFAGLAQAPYHLQFGLVCTDRLGFQSYHSIKQFFWYRWGVFAMLKSTGRWRKGLHGLGRCFHPHGGSFLYTGVTSGVKTSLQPAREGQVPKEDTLSSWRSGTIFFFFWDCSFYSCFSPKGIPTWSQQIYPP